MAEADEAIRNLLIKTGGSQAKGINDLPGLTIPGRMFLQIIQTICFLLSR